MNLSNLDKPFTFFASEIEENTTVYAAKIYNIDKEKLDNLTLYQVSAINGVDNGRKRRIIITSTIRCVVSEI